MSYEELKQKLQEWDTPKKGSGCKYPDLLLDSELQCSDGLQCLDVALRSKDGWCEREISHMYFQDRTFLAIIFDALAELDMTQKRVIPLQTQPGKSTTETLVACHGKASYYAISYVHRTTYSTRGLMKVEEDVELHVIEKLIARAERTGRNRIFVWSDRTLAHAAHKHPASWPLIGLYGYAVIPTIAVLDRETSNRLWPSAELTLSELGPGFVVLSHKRSPVSPRDLKNALCGKRADRTPLGYDLYGKGLTARLAMFGLARQFLLTGLGGLDTYFQQDRLLLRDLFVSLLKSNPTRSFGHHVLCGPECHRRKWGRAVNFINNLSAKVLTRVRPMDDIESTLWGAELSLLNRSLLLRAPGGVIRNIREAMRASFMRTGIEGWYELVNALETVSNEVYLLYDSGIKAELKILTSRRVDESLDRYWKEYSILSIVSISSEGGNSNWPGASMVLSDAATRETYCLLSAWWEADGTLQDAIGDEISYLVSQEIKLVGAVPRLGNVVATQVNLRNPSSFTTPPTETGEEGIVIILEDHIYVRIGGKKIVLGVGNLVLVWSKHWVVVR